MNLQIITAPLIGGLIGLITNSLAIKMLFRPYNEIRIAGIHIPFTPGLIPKEKTRIAEAIAKVIANYILDGDTILTALVSEQMKETYEKKYDEILIKWKSTYISLKELLEKYQLDCSADILQKDIRDSVSNYIIDQCIEEDIARKAIIYAFSTFEDHMNPLVLKVGKKALNAAQEAVISHVEDLIKEDGKEYIGQYIDKICTEWMEKPVCDIVIMLEEKLPETKQNIWETYVEFIQHKFGNFLYTLNIQKVIESKIIDYDFNELENMIMEISKKELNALVWLGGLLGVIMGFVNLLF